MTSDVASTNSPDFVIILAQAADAFRGRGISPAAEAVVNALLQAEKAAKQQRLTYSFESLLGRWRLCFATGTRKAKERGGIVLGRGFYVPKFVPAYISFATQRSARQLLQRREPPQRTGSGGSSGCCFEQAQVQTLGEDSGRGEISNQVQLSALLLKLTGPCQYLNKKNLLAFEFTGMQLSLFGRTVYSGDIRGGKAQAQNFYNQAIAVSPFFAFFWVTEDFIAARGRGGGLALWIRAI